MAMPFAATAAGTKRATLTAGKRGAPVTYLTGLVCTPPDAADRKAELMLRAGETPHRLLETYIEGLPDIQEGDRLVVGSAEYAVRAVARWAKAGSLPAFTQLLLEDEASK
jgi:hypothetical protein